MKKNNCIQAKTVTRNKKIEKYRKLTFYTLFIYPVLFYFNISLYDIDTINIIISIFFVIHSLIYLYLYSIKRYFIEGKICFALDYIKINNNYIMISDLLEINFSYSGYEGSLSDNFIFSNIPGIKDGINNFVYIKTKKGKIFKKEILISYKYFIYHLKKRFINYKNKDIKVEIKNVKYKS